MFGNINYRGIYNENVKGGDIVENLANNDFFLKFRPVYDEEKEIVDYTLLEASGNFHNVTKTEEKDLIGRSILKIAADYNRVLGLEEYYFYSISKSGRKFELYNEELDRWYFISIYLNKDGDVIVFYTDITVIEEQLRKQKQDILDNNLRAYCYRDKLTDLYTKDFFEEELHRLDTERQLPLSIIMGDLNGLKLINDSFGHRMGDRAIRMVGKILKDSFRKEDIISRIGGDEFLILLPKTSKETASEIVQNLKTTFSEKTLGFLPLSVSFGVATKTNIGENIEDTMKRAEDRMYFIKLEESKAAKLFTIEYLKEKLRKISFETKSHKHRLLEVTLLMADHLNLSEIEKEELKLLCEYHDIGKIGVPHHILLKEGALNEEEWMQMKRHSEIGYHIIRSAKETLAVDELVLLHHERWDGQGYPRKLKGNTIPLSVRLFAIADAYVAMTEGRPYKNSISHEKAIEEIRGESGIQFDPAMVRVFEEIKNDINFKDRLIS